MTDNPTLFDLSQYAIAQIADCHCDGTYDPYWQKQTDCQHTFTVIWTKDIEVHYFCTKCHHSEPVRDEAVLRETYQSVEKVLEKYQLLAIAAGSSARRREFEEGVATKKQQLAHIEELLGGTTSDSTSYELLGGIAQVIPPSKASTSNELLGGMAQVRGELIPPSKALTLNGLSGEQTILPSKTEGLSGGGSNNSILNELLGGTEEETIPPSKMRRQKGLGTGYVEQKPIIRNDKEYPQYWYHYEVWEKGDRLVKRSKYIPKQLVAKIQELEEEKAPVREILELLGVDR